MISFFSMEILLVAGALDKGGVGALELVAMDMKARSDFFFFKTI